MQQCQSVEEAVQALKNGEILYCQPQGQPQVQALSQDRVRVRTRQCRYSVTLEEWLQLFSQEDFYITEPENSADISAEKDEEYYSWAHK